MSALSAARRRALLFPSQRSDRSEGVSFDVSEITVAALSGKAVTFGAMRKMSQVAGFSAAEVLERDLNQRLSSTLAW